MDQGWLLLPHGRVADCLLDPTAGRLIPWVVPYSKHELAGHQGVGESPPHGSKLNSKDNPDQPGPWNSVG